MTLANFHAFCSSIKTELDAMPLGSTGALAAVSAIIHESLVRAGIERWISARLGATRAASLVTRLPTLTVTMTWGWLTTGVLTRDDLARGLVAGLLGPALLGLAKRPPSGPSSGVTTGSAPGAPPSSSPSSLGAKRAGPVVTLLLRSVRGLTTKRPGLTRPSSLPLLIAGAALIQGCVGGQMRARSPEFEACYLKADAESLERYKRECASYESISECPSGIVEPIEVEHQAAQEACK